MAATGLSILGVITFLLALFAMAFPWYAWTRESNNTRSLTMLSWLHGYCDGSPCPNGGRYLWYPALCGERCPTFKQVYDVAGAFMGLALASSFFMMVLLCMRREQDGKAALAGNILSVSTLVFLIIAVVTFAARHAPAMRTDFGCTAGRDACSSFAGSSSAAGVKTTWQPAGWIIALATIFPAIAIVYLAWQPGAKV